MIFLVKVIRAYARLERVPRSCLECLAHQRPGPSPRSYIYIYMETTPELITLKFTRISIGQSNQAFSLGGLGYIFHNPCSCYAVN